jgi:hypothetical protein
MRRVLPLALCVVALSVTTASAQNVLVPSYAPPGTGFAASAPIVLPAAQPYAQPAPPVLPPTAPAPSPAPSLPDDSLFRRFFSPFAQPREAGGQASRTFNENFDGDFGGIFYTRRITTGFTTVPRTIGFTQRVVGFTPTTVTTINTNQNGPRLIVTTTNNPIIVNDPVVVNDVVATQRTVRLPLAARYSGILITDNDNPRPQDRFYAGYNFYDNIGGALNRGTGLGQVDLQRQMFGFEKTFLDGDASFGMRLPFVQQYGQSGVFSERNTGDLTLLWKYAFYNDRETGDLISGGLVLTLPTGSGSAILLDGSRAPHSTIFQPWGGFVKTYDRAYVQGITSLLIPTDNRDPLLWNNSIGVGYYIYRNAGAGLLTSIAPVAELHVRTPLSNRNSSNVIFFQDQVNVTGGLHFKFNRASLSTSVCVPIVGPRPWAVEAMSFLNIAF